MGVSCAGSVKGSAALVGPYHHHLLDEKLAIFLLIVNHKRQCVAATTGRRPTCKRLRCPSNRAGSWPFRNVAELTRRGRVGLRTRLSSCVMLMGCAYLLVSGSARRWSTPGSGMTCWLLVGAAARFRDLDAVHAAGQHCAAARNAGAAL
jgi:hypothetical protein